jgi:hypothetical protein
MTKTFHVDTAEQAFDVLRAVNRHALGNLAVLCDPPAKMLKALAAISVRAHPAYDECSGLPCGGSRDKCLFMSLAVRDFLVQIGFADATVRLCCLYIAANDLQDRELWSVGIGAPGQEPMPETFNGHAVCTVPSLELLINTTVYQAIRPQWAGSVGGMDASGSLINASQQRACPGDPRRAFCCLRRSASLAIWQLVCTAG